jgi:hypothetical protein
MTVESNMTAAAAELLLSNAVGKKWYVSKTFWSNVVASVALGVQLKYGFVFGPEFQGFLITGLNIILRKYTNEPIIW